jgi:serine/threonine protein kinase/WD40 repeat protein
MALAVGAKLGAYEIVGLLGAGGMGEVYRARDPRLGRDVAVKILPASFSENPERERRFEQEARATATLNHPNILAVYDVGRQDGCPYIVSELLEGESLRDKLRAGKLPVRRAIDYALQIIRGLAAAHEHGILHRDLKPDNIFITKDGRAKILDFGLAKLVLPDMDVTGGVTAATRDSGTGAGMLLGTVGYMSPEQVRGGAIDARSDLFSFGVVLYEMVSGQRAFKGATTADTISAILTQEPPELVTVNKDVPPLLDRIVRHCLEKEPAARFQSASDVGFDLESLSTLSSSSGQLPAVATEAAEKPRKRWLVPALLIAAAAMLVAGMLIGHIAVRRPAIPEYSQLTFARETINTARFVPNQQMVVYGSARKGGRSELFSVATGSPTPTRLGQKNTDIVSISPNGELLLIQEARSLGNGYEAVGVLSRAPLSGAGPRPVENDVQDADWGPNDQIATTHYVDGRYRLEYPIGHVLYETSGWVSNVRVSPKGDLVAFADHPDPGDNAGTIAVVDSAGRKRNLSTPQKLISGLAWDPSGDEVWFSGTETGVRRRVDAVDLSGRTRAITRIPGSPTLFDIARDGRVLLSNGTSRAIAAGLGPGQSQERDLTVVDWTLVNAISPDGRTVLLEEEGTGSGPKYDIYVRSFDSDAPVHLGDGAASDFSPDMKWVLASAGQLFLVPLGPGEPRQITHDSIDHVDARFLPGGKAVAFTGIEPGHKARIYTQSIEGGSARAISEENVQGAVPTADGKFVFGFSDVVALYPVDGQGPRRIVPGIHTDDNLACVTRDGRSALVTVAFNYLSLQIVQVDLASGRRQVLKTVGPPDPTGVAVFPQAVVTPDGKYYAYEYGWILNELYTVTGLK